MNFVLPSNFHLSLMKPCAGQTGYKLTQHTVLLSSCTTEPTNTQWILTSLWTPSKTLQSQFKGILLPLTPSPCLAIHIWLVYKWTEFPHYTVFNQKLKTISLISYWGLTHAVGSTFVGSHIGKLTWLPLDLQSSLLCSPCWRIFSSVESTNLYIWSFVQKLTIWKKLFG